MLESMDPDKLSLTKGVDPEYLQEIKESLAKYGQLLPVRIDNANRVLDGNGLVLAARLLGWKTISVVVNG